ncbi:hypothetical protein Bca4012_052583 [Brassica carinata]|uniref:(rape) hypothetical protein n=1 Tax=Brassica napus TaxID=3708 RepID=A0A816KIU0_BRANA|nr:unnamed protein product [Brassica napus]
MVYKRATSFAFGGRANGALALNSCSLKSGRHDEVMHSQEEFCSYTSLVVLAKTGILLALTGVEKLYAEFPRLWSFFLIDFVG